MDHGEVLGVLADLTEAGRVAGGWGVDALVGQQTRLHRDLDLALDARDEPVALRALERRGYRVETDWRPVRVELIAEGRGWVDVHPVVFRLNRARPPSQPRRPAVRLSARGVRPGRSWRCVRAMLVPRSATALPYRL
jgi:hypothetical protein